MNNQGCDLDAYLLSKLEWPRPTVDPLQKARRESASQIDEFFEDAVDVDIGRFAISSSSVAGVGDWEDITTSLSKIDPDIVDMLELVPPTVKATLDDAHAAVKVEPCDDCGATNDHHLLRPLHHSNLGNSVQSIEMNSNHQLVHYDYDYAIMKSNINIR